MKNKVKNTIEQFGLLNLSSKVLVGVSGGADSVALLSVLCELKAELGFEIVAIHINHNLRGEEALRDQHFVEELCRNKKIELIVKNIEVKSLAQKEKKTIEQVAREYRYLEFEKACQEFDCTEIAVAHNKDDQAETILMHLFRGAGLNGLCGMRYKTGHIIRPLLGVTRREIEEYNKKNKLNYVQDSTNLQNEYRRNCIRNLILPEIEKLYPTAKANICAVGERLRAIDGIIHSKLNLGLVTRVSNTEVKIDQMITHESLEEQKLLVMEAFRQINFGVDMEEKHINQVLALFGQQVGKRLNLPNGLIALKNRDSIDLIIDNGLDAFEPIQFSLKKNNICVPLGSINVSVSDFTKNTSDALFVDAEKIPANAKWRKMQVGDKFEKFSGGTKTLASYLTDKKVEANKKSKIVVLANGSEVLVVPGFEISKKVKVDENTQKVVRICLKK